MVLICHPLFKTIIICTLFYFISSLNWKSEAPLFLSLTRPDAFLLYTRYVNISLKIFKIFSCTKRVGGCKHSFMKTIENAEAVNISQQYKRWGLKCWTNAWLVYYVEWLENICKTTVPAPADRDEFLIHHRDKHPVNENLQHLATIGFP